MGYIENKDLRITVFEAIGTIIFTYGVGCASLSAKDDFSSADGVLISCSLLAGLALCAEITDGHLNPLLSVAAHVNKRSRHLTVNLLGQALGGVLGVIIFWLVTGKAAIPIPEGDGVHFSPKDQIKFIINEFVGSFFFAVCVLVVTNHRTSYANKAWQMYLSVVVSLYLVRLMTGQTSINPAIAVPYQFMASILDSSRAKAWKFLYVLVPALLGGALGGYVVHKFYEPLLLYTKFHGELELSEEGEGQQRHGEEEIQQQ